MPTQSAPSDARRSLRLLGLLIGAALLIAALFVLWRQREVLAPALEAIRSPDPAAAALLLVGILGNLVLAGVLFSILMNRYGSIGRLEMQAVIASSALLNYLPMRPGFVGRIAYHKAVNRIRARDSVWIIILASAITGAICVYLALVALAAGDRLAVLWTGVLAPLPVLVAGCLHQPWRTWCAAGLVRYAEALLWAARYYAAFRLIGSPIAMHSAVIFAAASVIATMVPLLSNGLGLREWVVGLLAPLLTAYELGLGITAELVNRAAEIAIVAIAGTIGMWYLARRRQGAIADGAAGDAEATADERG